MQLRDQFKSTPQPSIFLAFYAIARGFRRLLTGKFGGVVVFCLSFFIMFALAWIIDPLNIFVAVDGKQFSF